jgi:hypothetical protein
MMRAVSSLCQVKMVWVNGIRPLILKSSGESIRSRPSRERQRRKAQAPYAAHTEISGRSSSTVIHCTYTLNNLTDKECTEDEAEPQLSKELIMETKATKATAPRGVRGIDASQRMIRATGGELATT